MKGVMKTGTKVAGWTSIAAALLTLVAKHFNLPVSEDFIIQVLGLLGLGAGGVVASSFMAGSVQMPSVGTLQTKTIESFNHLQSVLPSTPEMKSALEVIWSSVSGHLKETPKPAASSWGTIGSFVQAEIDKYMPTILEQIAKKSQENQVAAVAANQQK